MNWDKASKIATLSRFVERELCGPRKSFWWVRAKMTKMKNKQKKNVKKIQKHKPQSTSSRSNRFPVTSVSASSASAPLSQSNRSNSQTSTLSVLQQKFQKKLEGARFRTINERLYTCRGEEAFQEFQQNSNLFHLVSLPLAMDSSAHDSHLILSSITKDIVNKSRDGHRTLLISSSNGFNPNIAVRLLQIWAVVKHV
jgi:hypothetical protein